MRLQNKSTCVIWLQLNKYIKEMNVTNSRNKELKYSLMKSKSTK